MVRIYGSVIILFVTVDTLHAKRTKQKKIGRGIYMTVVTIGSRMCPDERKPASLMEFSDVVHHPGNRSMASSAFRPHSLIVHIRMTINTFLTGVVKFKGLMAKSAPNSLVLSYQRKFGRAMVERQRFQIDFPSIGIVAILAANLKSFAMRRFLREHRCCDQQRQDY